MTPEKLNIEPIHVAPGSETIFMWAAEKLTRIMYFMFPGTHIEDVWVVNLKLAEREHLFQEAPVALFQEFRDLDVYTLQPNQQMAITFRNDGPEPAIVHVVVKRRTHP